jgi:hypothetical protein
VRLAWATQQYPVSKTKRKIPKRAKVGTYYRKWAKSLLFGTHGFAM